MLGIELGEMGEGMIEGGFRGDVGMVKVMVVWFYGFGE